MSKKKTGPAPRYGETRKKVSVLVPPSKIEEIEKLAAEKGISKSQWCLEAIFRYLDDQKEAG